MKVAVYIYTIRVPKKLYTVNGMTVTFGYLLNKFVYLMHKIGLRPRIGICRSWEGGEARPMDGFSGTTTGE